MIKTIEVILNNGPYQKNYLFVWEKNICYYKDHKYQVTEDYKERILRIICNWKNEYGNDKVIDREEFIVKVITDEKDEQFHGKGIYPSNYKEFIEMLGDVNGNSR